MTHRTLPASHLRRVAVASDCDPRSVLRVLRDEPVLPMTRGRIVRALRDLGFGHLVPREDHGPRAA